ncbi:MAG: hypothetical protein ACYC7F_06380 [Gemmatimonadaceae bacterium]
MRWNPEEYLTVAKQLFGTPVPAALEGSERAAASRLYYASYLATRETCRKIKSDQTWAVRHARLIKALSDHADPNVRAIGLKLKTLCKARMDADYEMHEDDGRPKSLQMLILTADEVLLKQPLLSKYVQSSELPAHDPAGDR